MLIFRFLSICILILNFANVSHAAKADSVRHVKLYYPENVDAKGNPIPLTPQVLRVFSYFERNAGLKFSITILPWKRAQLEVAQGAGIIYGFSKSIARLEDFRFSSPVLSLPVWAISYGPENANIAEIQDLKDKIIVSSVGVTHGIEFERARNKIFVVEEDLFSHHERFKKLLTKRGSVILIPFTHHVSREQIQKVVHQKIIPGYNDPELNGRQFNVSLNPVFLDTIHFASSKQQLQDVIDKIDAAIARGSKNGSLTKLFKDY